MPRRPTPTVLRLLRGNPQRRPLPADEPQPGALDAAVPEELHGDPVAAGEWKRVIVPAIEIGLITAADRAIAIGYCAIFSQWRAESAAAAAAPAVVLLGRNAYPAAHPLRSAARQTHRLLLSVSAELGFTPASRSRVTADPRATRRKSAVERFRARKSRVNSPKE